MSLNVKKSGKGSLAESRIWEEKGGVKRSKKGREVERKKKKEMYKSGREGATPLKEKEVS